ALVHRPRLLVLDEATSALDPVSARALAQTLRGLRGRMTVLAISHQQDLVDAADRVYRMEKGRAILVEDRGADHLAARGAGSSACAGPGILARQAYAPALRRWLERAPVLRSLVWTFEAAALWLAWAALRVLGPDRGARLGRAALGAVGPRLRKSRQVHANLA